MFGDSLTEDLKDVIAGVYDGDEAPLRGLIENRQANEWARASAGLRAYPALLHAGKIGRDAVEKYFGELFEQRLEKEPSAVWDNLAGISAELGFTSLLPHIRRAYETGLCSPWVDTLGRVEKTLNAGGNSRWEEDVTPIDDVISLMETWTCFNITPPSPRSEPEAWPQFLQDALLSQREFLAHPAAPPRLGFQPAIGRNEPCPCGSGRKYKKCCGAG